LGTKKLTGRSAPPKNKKQMLGNFVITSEDGNIFIGPILVFPLIKESINQNH